MSDSDGEDAMAYFLPNGIADDSPPKRSALTSSFGSIGATRFGGIYGSTALQPAPLDLSAPLYGDPPGRGAIGSMAPSATAPRATFLLSDLGGEILEPRGRDARHPFAFSGAFASLSAAEAENPRYDPGRGEVVGTPKGQSSSAFRSDAEIFAPSSAGTAGVYGRPTLNANAPAFLASSAAQESAPFGSSSPSAWPTMNVKPRRAPPGLSKPADGSATLGGPSGASDGPALSLPPGLPHPSQSSTFGAYSSSPSTSSSLFSGDGVREFASKLRPSFPSLSDTFRSGGTQPDGDFKSTLSELNAKSMSVEEIQSNLKATALAAAHDVVSDTQLDQKAARLTTPRKTNKSPRRGVEFKSPSARDDKREPSTRAPVDPRSRTPTRRPEAAASTTPTHGDASPVPSSRTSGDRRGRNARESPLVLESSGRNSRAATSESSTRSGRRARGGTSGETRTNRTAQSDATSVPLPLPSTNRKKPPSSVSSVGSDDQLLTVSTMAMAVEESREVSGNVRGSVRDSKPTGRNSGTKKATPVQSQDKRGSSKRQVYREKVANPLVVKNEVVETTATDGTLQGGSDADASGAESQTDDNVGEDAKPSPQSPQPTQYEQATPAISNAPVEAESSPITSDSPPPKAEDEYQVEVPAGDDSTPKEACEQRLLVEEPPTSPLANKDESVSRPESPHAVVSDVTSNTPIRLESDSGSEIRELSSRSVRSSERKTSAKETKKDKHKKEKSDKKKATAPAKPNKKEKRDSSSSGKGDLADDEPFNPAPAKRASVAPMVKLTALLRDGRALVRRSVVAIWSACWFLCAEFADRINLKGFLGWTFSYLESLLAVVFSVILLLSLHGASFFIRLHRVAFRAVLTHRHVGFCFAFMYAFPFLVQYVFPWAPPWAPVCLWYAFLVQLFCTSGPAAMVATFRVILPLMFLIEGISHHSFLLDLNGAELLLASFILSAMKTSSLCSPIFLMSLAVQCLSAVFLGSELVVQWFQMTLALYSLHAMAATDEDWAGLGDDEEDLSCRPLSMHHSIADYNYHPAPSAPSIQKTKRLDRRALAYVRGRKLR